MKCDIVSARRTVYSGETSLVVAPGAAGELGIAPQHAPLLTTLNPGAIRVVEVDGNEKTFFIGGGIIEVMPHLITVLVDAATRATDFDEAAARRAKADAERVMKEHAGGMEFAEAQVKLIQTIEQLQALERWRRRVEHRK